MQKLILALIAIGFASAAAAKDGNQTNHNQSFTGINTVIISDFTGRLEVEIADGDVGAALMGGEVPFPFSMSQEGDAVTLAGRERPRNYNIHDHLHWRKFHENTFEEFLNDYPTLRVRVPAGTALTLDNAIAIVNIGDLNGQLIVNRGFLQGDIGDMADADISVYGSEDISLGAVRDHLKAKLGGSGNFTAASAGSAYLALGGSGDMEIGAIAGDADLKISGSGDIAAADIRGAMSARVSGSGDIKTGDVGKGGAFKISGSGDIDTQSVNGSVTAQISGSGDISIGDGRAENLEVRIQGSGDFEFDGVSTNLDASVHGSGSVNVAKNTGSLRTSGRGEFRIGGITIEND